MAFSPSANDFIKSVTEMFFVEDENARTVAWAAPREKNIRGCFLVKMGAQHYEVTKRMSQRNQNKDTCIQIINMQ